MAAYRGPAGGMSRPIHRRHTAVCGADRQRVWARASVSGGVGSVGGELVERQCARQATGPGARHTDRPGQPARADKTKGLRPWWCPLRQWYHEGILPVFRSAGIIRSLKVHDPMKVCVKYFDNFLFTATHWIPMAYKNAFYFNALQEQEENQIVVRIEYYGAI